MEDWDDLRFVLAAARAEGLSGAARALGTTHATVSRRIARIEADLGQPLFDRLPTGLRLTAAGAEALAIAESVEDRILALDLALAARGQGMEGTLRVTVPPLLITEAVAADFRAFREAHRRVDLEVLGDNRILNLHRREADVAIRVSRNPSETLWGRQLTAQHATYYASDAVARAAEAAIAADDPTHPLPFVSFTAWSEPVPAAIRAQFPRIEVAARCDDMVAGLRLAVAGMGAVRMPVFLGAATEGLRRIAGTPVSDYSPIWILTHPDLRHTPRVTAFMRFLGDRFAARRADYVLSETAPPG